MTSPVIKRAHLHAVRVLPVSIAIGEVPALKLGQCVAHTRSISGDSRFSFSTNSAQQRGCCFPREGKQRASVPRLHRRRTLRSALSGFPIHAGAVAAPQTAPLLHSVEGAVTRSLWQCAGSDRPRGRLRRFSFASAARARRGHSGRLHPSYSAGGVPLGIGLRDDRLACRTSLRSAVRAVAGGRGDAVQPFRGGSSGDR